MRSDWEFAYSARGETSSFDYYRCADIPRYFADGFANLQISGTVAKFDLYSVEGTYKEEDASAIDIERRYERVAIALPLRQLVELAEALLTSINRDPASLSQLIEHEKEAILNLAKQVVDSAESHKE